MFQQPSLDKILAGFNKVITDLIELTDNHDKNIADKSDQICDLESEIKAHNIEKARALVVLKNLDLLLTGDSSSSHPVKAD